MDSLGKIYGKPLVRDLNASVEKTLHALKRDVLKRLREKLLQSTFSDRAKRAFAKAIAVEIGPSSITILSSHPAFSLMLKGQKPKQMTWLRKSPTPIPIITETGELIFRTATVRSMTDGKWYHPGRNRFDFVETAKREAKAMIRKRLVAEIQRVVNQAAGRANRKGSRR